MLAKLLKPDLSFNLANESIFLEFAKDPGFLESEIRLNLRPESGGRIFLDEVQRLPRLLNTVQSLIDGNRKLQFILTGSSARKLKRGQANLLPGRVHTYEIGPIVSVEMNYQVSTERAMTFGTLPEVAANQDDSLTKRLLRSYATTYLQEEIKAEALTKNMEGFIRFLFRIAADSTKFLDLSKISKAIGVPRQTVQRYFEILEDTLIIKRCDAFAKSDKRRLVQHPKFYIFDNGVLNALLGGFQLSVDRKDFLFENLFFNQLASSLSYSDRDYRISSYRTDAGAEVDFVLELDGKIYALELKAGEFSKKDLGGLLSLESYVEKKIRSYVVIPDGRPRLIDHIEVLPWQKFLETLDI